MRHGRAPFIVQRAQHRRLAPAFPRCYTSGVREALSVGDQIAQFRIVARLGAGGVGEVFRAHDLNLNRFVALKTLLPERVQSDEVLLRFIYEGHAQAKLDHKHVLPVYAADSVDGLEPKRALAYMTQVAEALDFAHGANLIHRDLKPSNILVELSKKPGGGSNSHLYLADFGLARDLGRPQFTVTGFAPGTPMYMAPEQHAGQVVRAPADIFAFTLILYEALSGAMPFGGEFGWEGLRPLQGRASALNVVLARGLALQPEKRWRSAGELISACEHALNPTAPWKNPAQVLRQNPQEPTGSVTAQPSLRRPPVKLPAVSRPEPPQAGGERGRRQYAQNSRVRIRRWAGIMKPEETGISFSIHADAGRTGTVLGNNKGIVTVRWDPQSWSKVGRLGLKGDKVALPSFTTTISRDWLSDLS
jgi:serine/threonine protein kinase